MRLSIAEAHSKDGEAGIAGDPGALCRLNEVEKAL